MRILVTGANGFLGRGLAAKLTAAYPDASRLVLTDTAFEGPQSDGMEQKAGDLCDPEFQKELLEPGFDLVFHLASVPGSLAEKEPELGHQVNLLAPLALARGAAARCSGARFVFASSIAVYGDLNGLAVTPATQPAPLLTYGAHKLMLEIQLADMTRRGELRAVSLRFPGLVARPPVESGHGSAFMSQIFHRIAAGQPFDCPVPAASTCWWLSREAAVTALLHAARIAPAPGQTVIQLPVLHASLKAMSEAIAGETGMKADVHWGNDEVLQRIFGAMPPLDATPALALGFQADADLGTLTRAALSGEYL
ncbi:NAD-dependent epimerase/dehydratase family protein [Roseibium litorale]|uniref:NAD-dependent epimerase/dehydratase family protein n=1 Tax=Roseibium litorale TaxID=2803841 RepID=A0ABR9CQZ3_9HYPH|nr:NAD-dependent epimerase/dehydratase family protein [Roseibium litorale]MBD8893296.1 NAD-dependent epimerase/dehydratase family protein [Roseibium litorale]